MVRRLLELGAKVNVADNFSRGDSVVENAYYSKRRNDVTDPEHCREMFEGVDIVFNLAATVAGVLHNMNHHHDMFYENVKIQTVPVAVAEEVGIEHFLQVSSVCVYAPNFLDPAQEANGDRGLPHKANWGYAWAKRMGERMLEISEIPHGVIVRPSNIYGPGDYFDDKAHVIPALIKRAYDPEPLEVYGRPDTKREFLYVEDAAEGMLYAMAFGKSKEAYNIGTDGDTQVTLQNLVSTILELTGHPDKEVTFLTDKGGGDPTRRSDERKMSDSTGWTYSMPLEQGLEETVRWYENTRNNVG